MYMFGLLEENAKSIEPMVTLSHIGASSTMMGVLGTKLNWGMGKNLWL